MHKMAIIFNARTKGTYFNFEQFLIVLFEIRALVGKSQTAIVSNGFFIFGGNAI